MRDWTKIGAIGNIALVVLNLINLILNLTRYKIKIYEIFSN